MTAEPIKISRARVARAVLAEIPARLRAWWHLQLERTRDPFYFDLPESDEPALPLMTATTTRQEYTEILESFKDALARATGPRAELAPSATEVVILPWVCPTCEGAGRCESLAGRCPECDGRGAITTQAAEIWAEIEGVQLQPTPTPPAVMGRPCGDCAFRPGAPEEAARPSLEQAFYCHHGMPVVNGGYAPTAWAKGMPLGAMVCNGWWAAKTGKDLPARAYRPANDGWGNHA